MDIPAFHPEWIVTFWLTTPGLNKIDPHIILVLLISILVVYYFKRKNKVTKVDSGEDQFQILLMKKKILEKELVELNKEENQDDQMIIKKKELEAHLDLTKKKLQEFTL